ncbi:hypothetical protein NB640_12000 [Oxalobacter vibrioformis]|uniref:Uncharacterized protein n=1 Tax=Oxalobacter vibrioformis TaxID=933080 RepID=A0A9E9LX95_9BURK|nr:hypothetical protein [Oxalobacter vibrioformis]WAW09926.1 hypothetical protein NB640_12000 [Oxalobacter vibrioformis]
MDKKITYHRNPHIAFPLGFGDMRSQSAFAEIYLKDRDAWRTVRIEAIGYDDYTKKEAERGGSLDRIFPGITRSMGRLPDPDALWLYTVTAFTTKAAKNESLLILPTGEDDIRVEWFDDFHAALDWCESEYGIRPSDVKKTSPDRDTRR